MLKFLHLEKFGQQKKQMHGTPAHKWITGANYIPANAINQLEMWQAATFDPATIDKELGWAESIGFNAMQIVLHSVAWKQDPGRV